MDPNGPPSLTSDELDDLLYLARANESHELHLILAELQCKYQCAKKDILQRIVDQESGNTILHFCSANGFVDLLKHLLSELVPAKTNGLNEVQASPVPLINCQNRQGNTALHWAALNGHLEVLELLIGSGADMWIKNSAGHLAMFEAEQNGKDDATRYLLEVGGRRVEQTGHEDQASVEDVADVPNGGSSMFDQPRAD